MREEAYKAGYESEPEKGFLDNPYPDDSDEARIWVDGKVQAIIDIRNGEYKKDEIIG